MHLRDADARLLSCVFKIGSIAVTQQSPTVDDGRFETCSPRCTAEELVTTWQNCDYQLQGKLGDGGMAQVFRAVHLPSQQPVAVKVFRRSHVVGEAEEQQSRAERDALARLRHTHIVRLFDPCAGEGDGYLVMELIEGENLAELVRHDGPLPVDIASEVIRQTAVALQHMHDRGLMHRDVKPENLMLSADGLVKIIDVGLALWGRANVHEASCFLAGTLDYMAPEQFRASDQIDARADIYSLGCTLYYLLT
jgi:serine/threonine-protein kinase